MAASSKPTDLTQLSWTWRSFGSALMLVTERHGALVVLCGDRGSPIFTRGEDGVLRPIQECDPVAQLIASAPLKLRGLQTQLDTHVQLGRGREGNLKRAGDQRDKLLAALRSLESAAQAHLETTDGSEREYLREECSAARTLVAEMEVAVA